MNNLILFINSFLSYLLCFALIVVLVLIAIKIGCYTAIRKNEKAEQAAEAESSENSTIE